MKTLDITQSAGITSWNEFKNKYSKVSTDNTKIEFNRHDNIQTIWRKNLINKVDLNKTVFFNSDISQMNGDSSSYITTYNGGIKTYNVAGSVNWPFLYNQDNWQIFNQSIKHEWTCTQEKLSVGLQSYIRDNDHHLIFRICKKTEMYSGGTIIGATTNIFLGDSVTFS